MMKKIREGSKNNRRGRSNRNSTIKMVNCRNSKPMEDQTLKKRKEGDAALE